MLVSSTDEGLNVSKKISLKRFGINCTPIGTILNLNKRKKCQNQDSFSTPSTLMAAQAWGLAFEKSRWVNFKYKIYCHPNIGKRFRMKRFSCIELNTSNDH